MGKKNARSLRAGVKLTGAELNNQFLAGGIKEMGPAEP
jgi:hypothetical protein